MKSVTTWSDILALNCWVNLRSRLGWFASILLAALITHDVLSPRPEGRSIGMALALYCVVFGALLTMVWLVVFVGILLVTSANLLRRISSGKVVSGPRGSR